MKQSQITYWCHEIIRSQAEEGGYYIDATMGKGNDTLFLCELAGEKGKVLQNFFEAMNDMFLEMVLLLAKLIPLITFCSVMILILTPEQMH